MLRRRARGFAEVGTADHLGLAVSLMTLADYVAAGYYPAVRQHRCALVPMHAAGPDGDANRRRTLQHAYEMARLQGLNQRGRLGAVEADRTLIDSLDYEPDGAIDRLQAASPRIILLDANDDRQCRGLWRAVRATWSLPPDASAPGREVSLVAVSANLPDTPIGILQFRNVVPEIKIRDRWLGIVTGSETEADLGFVNQVLRRGSPRDHLAVTRDVLVGLLGHVRRDGLKRAESFADVPALREAAATYRREFDHLRRDGQREQAREALARTKRAETAADLLRGIEGLERGARCAASLRAAVKDDGDLRALIDAGLRKLWHYHMGFVAVELSICGASPPFGAMRAGKLMAGLAGSAEAIAKWGYDRPLGDIAATVYDPGVRSAVPNPGPLVVFTSGLYPGHSAQYTRASSGASKWRKIGETTGFGTFQISVETLTLMSAYNHATDGYAHVGREFGEGASPRFRAAGRALSRLGLPDLRRHHTQRPVYALPLVADPAAVLLGWEEAGLRRERPSAADIAEQWWSRWVRSSAPALAARARDQPDLRVVLDALLRQAAAFA
jgi:hypothetical protein